MKKIVILSYFIAFAFVVLFPRSFIFAAEETENYETVMKFVKGRRDIQSKIIQPGFIDHAELRNCEDTVVLVFSDAFERG